MSLSFLGAQDIQTAGDLFVDLDARDPTAGTATWANNGILASFARIGEPLLETIQGAKAVTFNAGLTQDAYQCLEVAPDGLIGPDPTRSIEVWVNNPAVADEETMVAWARRGGPNGSNMSFNYGTNPNFGAVGHWNLNFQDIGWGTTPEAGKWHHLVYTYDGETTRVYVDGVQTNEENLGPGAVNTWGDTAIILGVQYLADGVGLDWGVRSGTLSIGKVRIHDGVLTPEQILNNYNIERPLYPLPEEPPGFPDAPTEDFAVKSVGNYTRQLRITGYPVPTITIQDPLGATITPAGLLTFNLPDPAPAEFLVSLRGQNRNGSTDVSWKVFVLEGNTLQDAGEVFVDLDANDPTAGTLEWNNAGTLDNFIKIGEPELTTHIGAKAIRFNKSGTQDAYQCLDDAPDGLIGPDPTRSIEVWAYNPEIADEETLVAWARRGGPDGSNMSFNYGTNQNFGAVGHWNLNFQDIGWGPEVPAPRQWHHLVYTYDGTTTRVYSDGQLFNSEVLGPGAVTTHGESKITLAQQIVDAAGVLDFGVRSGTLSIGRVRIHDGVLSDGQILNNFLIDKDNYIRNLPPAFLDAPAADEVFKGVVSYSRRLDVDGFPPPTLSAPEPAGATITPEGLLTYPMPGVPPASFNVRVVAQNALGTAEATWTVTVKEPPTTGQVEVAGELFVDLDAADPSAGSDFWENQGSLNDFMKIGSPEVVEHFGAKAVSFNSTSNQDAYQCLDDTPPGLVGVDPTRTIEVWAFNPSLVDEETMVAWSRRGGGPGTNMSFNYGTHTAFGAVGHWDAPDIGWGPAPTDAPAAGQWHHLVYTYDGTTTRVYADGSLKNSEELGPGVINTYGDTKITLAQQIVDASGVLDFSVRSGTLSLGRVRIHDEVLTPEQVLNNFLFEKTDFPLPPAAIFTATPTEGDEPLDVRLDASGSSSPNGAIQDYSWDFGDGGQGIGPIQNHTFAIAGVYTVVLTITDDKGASATATRAIAVNFRSGDVSPWKIADVGVTPPLARGGARLTGECFTVHAGGSDIGARADQFLFIHRELSGDASITARIDSVLWENNLARIGVMLRESLAPGARHASMFLANTAGGRYSFLRRVAADGTTALPVNSGTTVTPPDTWVRIERKGSELIGSWSSNGTDWTELSRITIDLPADILGGIAATARDLTSTGRALDAMVCDVTVSGALQAPEGLVATAGDKKVDLDWNDLPAQTPPIDGYNVYRSNVHGGPYAQVNTATVTESRYTDSGLANDAEVCYVVRAVRGSGTGESSQEVCATPKAPVGTLFKRGDTDVNGSLEITDPINLLGFLFLGDPQPPCFDAADADDNGSLEITDAIVSLGFQFLGEAAPPAPGPLVCGLDPSPEVPGADYGCEYPPENCQ